MQILDFYNRPTIGLFFFTTDKFTVVPTITPEPVEETIKSELKTKIIRTDIYLTHINNAFLCGNEKHLFVPSIVEEDEINRLKESGAEIVVLKTNLNALGNNMVMLPKNNILVNPKMEKEVIEKIESYGYKVSKGTIAGVGTVGAYIALFGKDALVSPNTREKEIGLLKSLGVETIEKGTVSNGSKIIKAGIVSNKYGVLVSKDTTGPEMMEIEGLWKDGYRR